MYENFREFETYLEELSDGVSDQEVVDKAENSYARGNPIEDENSDSWNDSEDFWN